MIEENPRVSELYQAVMSLHYLKESISTTKLALIDQYRDLFDLCKRCLMNGSKKMIEIGKELIKIIIEDF